MTSTFENDNVVIVYTLEKIISCAKDSQYIFLAQSVWWISSMIGLQQGLIIHINNLPIRSEIRSQGGGISLAREAPPQARERCPSGDVNVHGREVSVIPWDIQEDPRSSIASDNIHPDRIFQVNTTHNASDLEDIDLEPEQLPQIGESAEQFIWRFWKERKAFNKQKRIDALSRTRSGKVIAKPLSKKQRNYLQPISKNTISAYWADRK